MAVVEKRENLNAKIWGIGVRQRSEERRVGKEC